MAEWPHLPRAPITEALIDIRVQLPRGTDLLRLALLHDQIQSEYPIKKKRMHWEGRLQVKKSQAQISTRMPQQEAHLFVSENGLQVVQAGVKGFTFSRLKPYQNWESLRNEASRLWSLYKELAGPTEVHRLGLRFINRIDVPQTEFALTDWFQTCPQLGKELPQAIGRFFLRVPITLEPPSTSAILTQTIADGGQSGRTPVILDIDVICVERRDVNDDWLWSMFDAMRDHKNRLFFGSITQQCQELFQ